jgi:hypothetical protein
MVLGWHGRWLPLPLPLPSPLTLPSPPTLPTHPTWHFDAVQGSGD